MARGGRRAYTVTGGRAIIQSASLLPLVGATAASSPVISFGVLGELQAAAVTPNANEMRVPRTKRRIGRHSIGKSLGCRRALVCGAWS
jgi:hypothetical protein